MGGVLARLSAARVLVAGLLAAGAFVFVGVAGATFPGERGKLVYQKKLKNGKTDLFLANADGSKPFNVTRTTRSNEFNADWSPDGKRLVFESDRRGRSKLYIHTPTARQLKSATANKKPRTKQLTRGKGRDQLGRFCSKNTVVFVRMLGKRLGDLYSIKTNGKGLRRLTRTAKYEGSPVCSADGKWLYFVKQAATPDEFNIVRQRLRKGKLRGPIKTLAAGISPDISPDGTTLAFAGTDPLDASQEIFYLDLSAVDATPVQVTANDLPTVATWPRFAPDVGLEPERALSAVLGRYSDQIDLAWLIAAFLGDPDRTGTVIIGSPVGLPPGDAPTLHGVIPGLERASWAPRQPSLNTVGAEWDFATTVTCSPPAIGPGGLLEVRYKIEVSTDPAQPGAKFTVIFGSLPETTFPLGSNGRGIFETNFPVSPGQTHTIRTSVTQGGTTKEQTKNIPDSCGGAKTGG